MTAPTRVLEFRPVALHLQRVGPFQEGPLTVAFTDPEGEPCNLFILLSENGRGKTTILESLAYLASLLAPDGTPEAEPPRWLADHPEARLQLDLRVKTELDGRRSTVVLSLLAGHGEDPGLAAWTSEQLAALGASDWVRYGYGRTRQGVVRRIGQRGEIAGALRAFVAAARSRPPQGFEDEPTEEAPTVLYSPSDRNLVPPPPAHERGVPARPRSLVHRAVHRFGREGGDWGDSADALLVWLHWMDDGKGRFVRAQGILNQHVFRGTPKVLKGIRKDPPEALVSNGDKSHRLDQLSSGERSLVQVFLRLHAHLTCNTILLIDELDLHLHPRWRRRAVRALKETALANPGLTVIFVAHSLDVLDWFDPEIPEPPLRKSGHIIMEGFVGAPGEGA